MGHDQEIPAIVEDVSHVAPDVAIAVVLGGKQVA
jgi:hypothetical protein